MAQSKRMPSNASGGGNRKGIAGASKSKRQMAHKAMIKQHNPARKSTRKLSWWMSGS